MATLFTTSNIVVSSLLKDQNLRGFGVFDFAPLGLIFVGIGVVYMIIWGQRLLPIKSPVQRLGEIGYQQSELTDIYRLEERLFQARIPDTSLLCGVSLADSNLREKYNINLVGIKRNSKVVYSPSPDFRFLGGDILLIEGRPEEISPEALQPSLTLLHDGVWDEKELGSKGMRLFEAVLAPRSNLIGQTLRSVNFREKFDMNVIAIWRAGRPIRTHLSELPLQFGDALLIQGKPDKVQILQSEPSLIVLDDIKTRVLRKPHKAWLAILIMAFTVGVAALSNLPTGEVMLFGALAMVLTGILSMDQVYQAIDWKSIFLIAGLLPLSIAMTKTGAATTIGGWLINIVGNATPLMILASLVVLTILLSQVMNGAAVATVVAPIAIGISLQKGIDPRSMAMGIAMAASMTFITPLGHAVNVLVMGPGGYRFRDFLLVGSPLTLLLFIALMVFLPMIWPLT
jgi:di/tricarboxylate transporter